MKLKCKVNSFGVWKDGFLIGVETTDHHSSYDVKCIVMYEEISKENNKKIYKLKRTSEDNVEIEHPETLFNNEMGEIIEN